MNLGRESEILEFKKSTSELEKAMDNVASILNKHGHGVLYFGVAPNGDVIGQQISASSLDDVARKIKEAIRPTIYPIIKEELLEDKTVIKVEFVGYERPYSSYGRYYKRVFDRTEEMTPEELRHMMAATDYTSYWENNLTSVGLEAVDNEALSRYYKKSVSCGRLEPMELYSPNEILTGLGLLENGKLTNAGYYLFSSKKPAVLKMAVYVTDERMNFSDIRRLEDNIYNLIEKAFEYVKEHINWRVENGVGTERIEVPEIPVQALREIIVNSFAHADYRGITENEIDITPTQVEIYNPGEFPDNVTPEMFATGSVKSMPRNRVILNTLFKSKDVEMFGSGLKKTFTLCKASGNKITYRTGNGGFSFVLYREGKQMNDTLNVSENVTINTIDVHLINTDLKVLQMLKEKPGCTREDIGMAIGKTVRTVQRSLDKLETLKKIVRIGSRKKGYWEVIDNFTKPS